MLTQETREWLDALEGVSLPEGADRAHYLIEKLIGQAGKAALTSPTRPTPSTSTPSPPASSPSTGQPGHGDQDPPYIRWNAMAMVVRANKDTNVGGHIVASFASAAALYDVIFSHFWKSVGTTPAATSSSSRAPRSPASIPAPSCSAAFRTKSRWTTSARKPAARASLLPHPG